METLTDIRDTAIVRERLREQVAAIRTTRVWWWRPSWHWPGWRSFIPIGFGHDEFARHTIVFGWPITGRMIFAYRDCGSVDCYQDALEHQKWVEQLDAEDAAEELVDA